MTQPLTRAELLALPATTNLRTLGQAFGLSEPVARERHRRGEWDQLGIRVLRLGQQWRVITADLWKALGVESGARADEPALQAAVSDEAEIPHPAPGGAAAFRQSA